MRILNFIPKWTYQSFETLPSGSPHACVCCPQGCLQPRPGGVQHNLQGVICAWVNSGTKVQQKSLQSTQAGGQCGTSWADSSPRWSRGQNGNFPQWVPCSAFKASSLYILCSLCICSLHQHTYTPTLYKLTQCSPGLKFLTLSSIIQMDKLHFVSTFKGYSWIFSISTILSSIQKSFH